MVSAPFAHRRLDHSGSLRTPNETSGTLALLPHVHHTPAYIRARPGCGSARWLDVDKSSAQFQIPLRPFVFRSRRRALCCAVLWCVLVIDIHRCCPFTAKVLSHQTRLTRLPPTQSAVCSLLALIRAVHALPLSSMPRANIPSSPRIRVVSPVIRPLQLVHASLPHFRLPTHITTCSGR